MWKDPEPDPGGTTQKGAPSGQELSDLKDQNEQQQLLIAQLKEMLRKEQSNVTQEKVEEYVNTLNKAKAKKTRVKRDESGTERSASSSSIDVNKKEKLNLLRQQMEENKARLAERGKNQKGIEDMVTQLKAQLNDSQQLINLAPHTSPEPKTLDYSRNSTPEELYNILLTKEKRITELVNRTQNQEAAILDLQENVKEKDSVIDARTKAITLMTESLSKKGKNTLDELDDTKEQMRKMQESFVTLEAEMKARQVKLLNDLKAKNLEIAELQENLQEVNKLKKEGTSVDSNEEIAALKKQLEEGNKNMIKVKAQSKSKIKELTKKIDAFRKISDANALVVQLQTENTKLSEKIAELEEEKGNMQLKMVESTESVKDSTLLEEHKELEDKLARKVEELDEKDKIISLLESDIISLKEEVKSLNEKISGLSHWENMEVTSEMKSIQIEEQMEKVEGENAALKKEIEEMLREKEELNEKIEELKKEKQELSSKLDNYIQENMELIDKLEKLSAEKVSSAESIEIVEGLTQQEKLELAAYQKNLDVHFEGEPIKCGGDDDVMDPPVELNESVMQLSEDSTELLQKIDMFTMERKEVMDKLETLKEENARLSMKIKEIENNRDILAETYEQLQNEKEEMQHENDELARKLRSFEEEGGQNAKVSGRGGTDLAVKLEELQDEYEQLLTENDELKRTLKEYDSKIHEKHNLETELSLAKDKIETLETNIKTNLEELTFYQSLVEENKTELINSANLINELQTKLDDRENDVKDLNLIINDLNGVVNNLQEDNAQFCDFESVIQQLKTDLNDRIQQVQDYEEDIARNNDIIENLQGKLTEMNRKIIEAEHDMEMKEIEAKKLAQELANKEKTIKNLQDQNEQKDKKINVVVEDMKRKYLSLQKQLDGNSDSLEIKVQELTTKNKEQMEKMKKIAANLKKKAQAYQELEAKYSGEKEKWESEMNEKVAIIEDSKDKMEKILRRSKEMEEEIADKTRKLAEAEDKIRELSEIVWNLEQSNAELQNSLTELRHREEKLNDVNLKQELSTSLHEEFDAAPGNQESASEEKIKELELIIETNNNALAHYTERVHKLEEDVARLVEEKEIAERKAMELSEQLNITSKNAEEIALAEEELGHRLAQVAANDEALVRKLDEILAENKELADKNKELEELTYKLKVKVKKAHERVTQLKALQASVEELEATNGELRKQLATLEASQRHAQDENEELQKRSRNDYERIEADYQTQMEQLVGGRNELQIECEKLREALKEMQAREEELLAEVGEYKGKMERKEGESQERIQELADELRVANLNWKDALEEIASLNDIIAKLRTELVTKVATETVESVITEARDKVIDSTTVACQAVVEIKDVDCQRDRDETSVACQAVVELKHVDCQKDRDDNSVGSQAVLATKDTDTPIEPQQDQIGTEAIPTFQWPTSQQPSQMQDWFAAAPAQEDPFSVIIAQEQSSSNVPRTGSDPSHVATPVDNTKEELLNKIRALEVLLYNVDKEKEEALRDCVGMINELTRLLYEKVNAPRGESTAPISDMESQITQERDALDAASKKKELHDIEFEKADVSLGEQSHPVVEEVVQPKRAYLTYQPEDKASSSVKPEAFGENDDGWGWGPEEAKLEEEHMSKAENDPRMQNLRSEIDQLKEKLRVLQVERENHLEEIKQLQIKSGKLIKKCKELKLKNDQMAAAQQRKKSDGAEFFNLDETIQEELKTQIAQLEKKIKELTGELEKEKLEKTNTLKRVDVLTAANERMVDMKEIQDAEVLRWKRKHEEAEEKLQHYEWGSDGFNEGAKPTKGIPEQAASTSGDANKIEELQQTIRELSADNDELQALLDEQRQLRVNAEKAKATRTEEEYELLNGKILLLEQELSGKVEEMKAVLEEKEAITRSKTHLEEALNAEQKLVEELRTELGAVMEKNTELERFLADKDKSVKELLENEKGQSVQEELTRKIAELEDTVMQLRSTIARQEKLLEEKSAAFGELQASFDEVDRLKEHLSKQVAQLTTDLDYQRENYAQLQSDASETNSNLQRELKDQQQRCEQLEMASLDKVNELSAELERVKRAYDQLQADGALKVAQLSEELQQQIMKYDQLQAENSEKVSELEALARGLRDEKNATVGGGEFEAAQQQHQLEGLMTEKDLALAELTENKAQLQREVEELTRRLEEKEKELERAVAETDEKISRAAADLEESWIAQVDQRGADIAESWKLHLDAVEAEFATTREKFKYEIDELEGKCNALVNENNELRKNVDAEIRNEVDRISALQQQINDRQQYITELNNKLIEKQNENEILLAKLKQLEHEKEQLKNDLVDKETKLSSMNVIFDTTQKQFDEKREVVEEIVRILEKNTSWPLSFEKQELLTEFQRQLSLVSEKEQEIMRLTRSVSEIQGQLNAIREKDEEIARFKRLTDDLQSQLSTLHEKDDEIFRLTKLAEESQQQLTVVHEKEGEILTLNKLVEDLQKELVSLRDKDAEIARLNRVIEELQRQIGSLQGYEGEILRLNQVIENYKAQHDFNQQEMARLAEMQSNANQAIEDYKQKLDEFTATHVVLQNSLDEKNQLIATLNQQLQFAENLKNDNNKNVEYLREEISQSKKDCATLQESLSECQQQLFAVTSDLANRTQEIEKLNQQLAYSQRNFEIQEAELNKLRELMQAKEQEYAVLVEGVRQGQLRDLENHYEEVLAAKDLDIESARSQLQESIENYEKLSENVEADANLRRQLEENSKQLEAKVAEQSALLDEENKQLIELRDIIEDQVMRIEALKKEVFEKSGDYDSLVAEIDIGRKAITQQPTSSANVAETQRERPQQEEEDLSEPVSRAELDLALYMLHQRDVRCEELTVELTQLLEERDTLQLRLSNAIREKEEIRRKLTGSEEVPTSSTSTSSPATPLSKSSAIFLAASGTELATEPSESSTSGMQELENKLSELKSVGYKKDKTFVDEQQLRRMQQISIMQQHMNEASRLPAEAAAKLVDASYTLSRDVQSPSKVLLNWLWGRSTPKVNDT